MNIDMVSAELLVLIVTVLGGFATLSFQIGRRSKDVDELVKKTAATAQSLLDHEKHCVDREVKTQERLAEGSKTLAIHGERLEAMHEDIREIKGALKAK